MKKILTLMIACAAITASAQTDSISTLISFHVPKAEPQVVHYPYITPISSHEELSHEVMQLNFSKADAAAKKLITTARRRRESTADFDKVVSICHKGENGLRGVDRVVIVDSVVVDKKEFLKTRATSCSIRPSSTAWCSDLKVLTAPICS